MNNFRSYLYMYLLGGGRGLQIKKENLSAITLMGGLKEIGTH